MVKGNVIIYNSFGGLFNFFLLRYFWSWNSDPAFGGEKDPCITP